MAAAAAATLAREDGPRAEVAEAAAAAVSASPEDAGAPSSDRASLYAMSAYTQLSPALASLIFSHYRLEVGEELVEWTELQGGLSNSNFRFRSSSGRRLLCKVCDEKSAEELRRQIIALLLLQPHHLQLAYPVQRTDPQPLIDDAANSSYPDPSRYLLCLEGVKPIVMYDFLDGRPPRMATPSVLRQLAQAQAALHCVDASAFAFLPSFPMGMTAIQPFIEQQLVSRYARHTSQHRTQRRIGVHCHPHSV